MGETISNRLALLCERLAILRCRLFGHDMVDCGPPGGEKIRQCRRCPAFWRESMDPAWRKKREVRRG